MTGSDYSPTRTGLGGVENTGTHMIPSNMSLTIQIITCPTGAPETVALELDGKIEKMYGGGKICLTSCFKPLQTTNIPMRLIQLVALGLGLQLAVEILDVIQKGMIQHKEKCN